MKGKEVEVNNTETYDNGVKVVPAYLLDPVSVDKSNYKKVLDDSGYYTEDQLNNSDRLRCSNDLVMVVPTVTKSFLLKGKGVIMI